MSDRQEAGAPSPQKNAVRRTNERQSKASLPMKSTQKSDATANENWDQTFFPGLKSVTSRGCAGKSPIWEHRHSAEMSEGWPGIGRGDTATSTRQGAHGREHGTEWRRIRGDRVGSSGWEHFSVGCTHIWVLGILLDAHRKQTNNNNRAWPFTCPVRGVWK